MKTKKCKYCQEQIAKNAKRCPKCGGKLGMSSGMRILLGVIIIIIGVVACANSFSDAVEDTKNSFKDINGTTSFKVNETFQNKYEKITMTEVNPNVTDYNEYLGPKDGNKIIALKFEVENISDNNDELYVSSYSFNAYADGVAADSYMYATDKYNDLSATVGKGKKAVGYVLYEVPANAQKITVEYNANFWTDGTVIEFVVQ